MKSYHSDEKRFKTKQRTKFAKTHELLRQVELERQCEEFYMSLDCKGVKGEYHEEVDDCGVLASSLEKGQVEVHTRSLESKVICVEAQEEGLKRNDLESKVGVKEDKSLRGSSWNEQRRNFVAGVLMCSCVGCVRESYSHGLDKLMGPKVGKVVTLVIVEVPWDLCSKGPFEELYIALYPVTQNLISCFDSYPTVKANTHRGYGYLVEDFGLSCCIVVIVTHKLWCIILPAILLSTWESVRGIKMEDHKHFHVQTHEAKVGMKCHGGCLEGMMEEHCQYHLVGMCGIPFQCCLKGLLACCGKSVHMRDLFKPSTTGFRRLNQWVKSIWDYDLPWFKWIIMLTVENGVVSYLWWRCGVGTTDCFLLRSVERECALINIQETQKGLRVMLIKTVLGYGSGVIKWLVMKGIGKGSLLQKLCNIESTNMPWLGEKGECVVPIMPRNLHISNKNKNDSPWERETIIRHSTKKQSETAEAIGKWFHIAELDVKSKGDRLKHIADAQVGERAAEIGRFRLKDLKHKSPIREATKMGMRAEYQDFAPLHSNTINCKMKSTQSSSTKVRIMLQMLSSKPMRLIMLNTRRVELKRVLKSGSWIMPIFELRVVLKGIINAEVVNTKAISDETMMDVFEWMIAWTQ